MSVFKPDNLTDAKYENKEYLMNAYDNTIRYTDGFLASLITLLQKMNSFSAMLYTSDHGEDILMIIENYFYMHPRSRLIINCMYHF